MQYLPGGHFDTSVDSYRRPHRWSEGEGHFAIMRYLTLVQDEILAAFPAGKLPPTDKVSLRDPKELAPYLKEPFSPGWKSVYGLPAVGQL